MNNIRNVFCVGRNYGQHAAELGNAVPDSPMIFMKPTHSLVLMDGNPIPIPAQYGVIHYEAELVIRIGSSYQPGHTTAQLIDGFALGIDLTMREVQDELKKKQHPWLKAKGFRSSAPITKFLPIKNIEELASQSFSLRINNEERQKGHINEMIFDLQTLLDHIGVHYGLDAGDIIFTGTPAGVGQVQANDHLQLYWGEQQLGHCNLTYSS